MSFPSEWGGSCHAVAASWRWPSGCTLAWTWATGSPGRESPAWSTCWGTRTTRVLLADLWRRRQWPPSQRFLPERARRAGSWRGCSLESWSWCRGTARCACGCGGSVWTGAWRLRGRWGSAPPYCFCLAPARCCPPGETGGALGSDCPRAGRRPPGCTSLPGPCSKRDIFKMQWWRGGNKHASCW